MWPLSYRKENSNISLRSETFNPIRVAIVLLAGMLLALSLATVRVWRDERGVMNITAPGTRVIWLDQNGWLYWQDELLGHWDLRGNVITPALPTATPYPTYTPYPTATPAPAPLESA